MSFDVSINGLPTPEMRIEIPYLGRMVVDAVIDTSQGIPSAPGGLNVSFGNLSIVATDFRSAPYLGIVKSRSVSGFGGWHKMYGPTPFSNDGGLQASYILGQIASAVGEKVNVASDFVVGSYWAAELAPAIRSLNLIARAQWWQDAAGVTQIGARASTMITSPFDVLDYEPDRGRFEIATDNPADWTPARQFSTASGMQTAATVIHTMTKDAKARTFVQVLPS